MEPKRYYRTVTNYIGKTPPSARDQDRRTVYLTNAGACDAELGLFKCRPRLITFPLDEQPDLAGQSVVVDLDQKGLGVEKAKGVKLCTLLSFYCSAQAQRDFSAQRL